MWLWQPRKLKQQRFWFKIVGVSCLLHLVMLFLLLFFYRGYFSVHTIDLGKTIPQGAHVVVLPLYKVAPRSLSGNGGSATSVTHKQSAAAKKEAMVQPSPKVVEPKTTMRTVARDTRKAHKKKKTRKAPRKKAAKKQGEEKKEVIVPEKKVELPAPIPQATPEQGALAPLEQAIDAQSPIYIGTLEADAIAIQQALKEEIEHCWKPPVGLAHDVECHVLVTVDWQGSVHAMDIVKKSGVLIFDMSAREAVSVMKFPQLSWGKNITIVFNV